MTYLVFLSKPTGYELHEHDGEPPAVGDEVEAEGERQLVTKVAPSPLPSDSRACVYLQQQA